MITDRRFKNRAAVIEFARRYEIKIVIVLAYYLQVNGIIECSHKLIVDTLLKILDGGFANWIQSLPTVL